VLDPLLGKTFTVFALIGAINAINHSDGLDGLAGGESLLSLVAMAVLAYVVGDVLAVGIALASIGGILGFLRYNSHPARVFMGDAGSQVLGFTLGFLAVYLTQIAHTAISAALPALLLGLPIADILVVLYLRASGGRNWFKATRNHVHHRLLQLGFDHYETVIVIYSIQALLVVSAVLLRYEADWIVAGAYLGVVGSLFAALHVAERSGFVLRREAKPSAAMRVAASAFTRRVPLAVVAVAVPGFMLLAAFWVSEVPRDFSVAAGVLAAVVAVELLRTRAAGSIVTRTAIYTTAIFSAYLLVLYPGSAAERPQVAMIATMAVLAVAIALYVRTTTKQEFGTTPTDYLVVFGVLAMIAFGSIGTGSRGVVELVAYATVLLYGCEVVLGRSVKRWPVLDAAALAALTVMAVRGAL
jgi:UDP-GlcNAc:undecaprenyl-phosphate GlcNAc-1-phosphate transferase